MRIGKLEIHWTKPVEVPGSKVTEDLSFIFAVEPEHVWIKAINQLLDKLEYEAIQQARNHCANANLCIEYVGNSEGIAMAKLRLEETREAAIRKQQDLNRQRVG